MRGREGYSAARTQQFIAMGIVAPPADYQALAQSMGVASRLILKAADLAPAIEAGIASGKPNLIEVPISV